MSREIETAADTIFALSSGVGRAGVAVIRVSGSKSKDVLQALSGELPEPRVAALKAVRDPENQTIIDRALVLWFPGPRSFSGEDMAELHLHGGRAIVEAVISALNGMDHVRMAEPGEFARRAFDNGKLDLTAAEGLADLINAETEAQRRQAFRQSDGVLQALYDGWRERLIHVLAMTEAALDFSDEEDVPGQVAQKVRPEVEALAKELSVHLDDRHRGEILRDGFHVVLAGATNVGKSSLLNVLAQRDAAIVSEEAGTTRDTIEVRLDLGGFPVIVTDTAGFRETEGAIEQEGMRRSVGEARKADLVLWLLGLTEERVALVDELKGEAHKTILVLTKSDLLDSDIPQPEADLIISAKTGAGIDVLTERLMAEASSRIGSLEDPAITNARQRGELSACLDGLQAYLDGEAADLELRAEDLRAATRALGRITGRVDVEDVLDRIFSAFCIGK